MGSTSHAAVRGAAVGALYLAAAVLEEHLTFPHGFIVPVRLSAGVGLFCLLWLGLRAWPYMAVAALLAALIVHPSFAVALGVGIGHVAGIVLAYVLINRLAGVDPLLSRASGVLSFALLAAAGMALSAILGVAALGLHDSLYWQAFATNWMNWWLGDVIGCLAAAPALMALTEEMDPLRKAKGIGEGVALFLSVVVVQSVIFAGLLPIGVEDYPLVYLVFPLLLWAAFRFSPPVPLAALVLIALSATAGTVSGHGPFVRETVSETAPLLQSFLVVAAMVVLIISAALNERLRAESDLRTARDGLEQRVAERTQELARLKQQAEDATRAKSHFLAAASHDLRQPLHAVGLFVAALGARIKDAESRVLFDNLKDSVAATSEMLNALLDLSKLDAGAMTAEVADFPLAPLLSRIGADFADSTADKGLELRIVPTATVIRSDPAMLESIVRNLVSNAVRYTSKGRVLLGCRKRGKALSLQVWDTGCGIPEDQMDDIFREYHQLANPERDRRYGLGLGLSIVDGLAKLLGHPLQVRSTVGKGSLFAIEVPLGDAKTAQQNFPAEDSMKTPFKGLRVLVIDDNPEALDAMMAVLESWGSQALLAGSADEAAIMVQQDATVPDAILADYRLRQGETGIQAIEHVHTVLGRKIPSVIITGDTQASSLKEIEDSPYRLLHKPVQPAALRALLGHILKENQSP